MDDWSIFGASSSTATPPPGYGPWERMSPLLSRRRKPDGTWEVRLTPSFKGGKPGVGSVAAPDTGLAATAKETVKTAGTAWMRNLVTAPEMAETVMALPGAAARKAAGGKFDLGPLATRQGDLGRLTERVTDIDKEQRDRLAAAAQTHPVIGTAAYGAAELAAGVLDPTNLPLGGAASRVPRRALAEEAMAARVAGKTPGVLEALAESAELRPEMGSIKLPGGERRIDAGLRREVQEAMERLRGLSDKELLDLGSTTTNRAEEIAAERLAFERRAGTHFGPPAGAVGGGGAGDIGAPGGLQPIEARPQMSTKGITNVAGMQPELQEAALENFDLIYAARGKPRPVSVYHNAQALADETGLTLADFLDTPAGRTWNDREMALGRSLLGGLRDRIKTTSDAVIAGTMDPASGRAAIAEDRFQLAKLMASLQGRGASEWGRAGRSLQEEVGAFNSLGLAQGPTEKLGLALSKRYADRLDDDVIRRISELDADDSAGLMGFLRTMERPRFRDYVGALAYHFLLAGPKSLARNVIGNTVKRWDTIVMRAVEAPVEQILARVQGRTPERYAREILPAIQGSYAGAPKGLQKALYVLKNGYDPQRLIDDLTGSGGSRKYMEAGRFPLDPFLLSKSKAVRAIGTATGYGPRIMTAGDAMAKSRSFSSASYAWATRKAIQEKAPNISDRAAQLLQEAPEEMLEYAAEQARRDTFTDKASNLARLFGAVRREDTVAAGALNYLVRFVNVPDRIGAWLTDYTPGARLIGALAAKGKLRQAWGTPGASDIIARQIVGTTVGAAAAAWAFQGKVTGAMPRGDDDLKNDAYAAGRQPWSVLLFGYWLPIRDVFGGLAAPVALAAAYHDEALYGTPVDSEEIARRFGAGYLGVGRYLLDASYLSTLSDAVDALEADPGTAGSKAVGLGARVLGGATIPWSGALRNAAIFRDPRVVEKDGFIDEIKAGIPGLRETLASRIGPLGEELAQNTGRLGGIFPVVPTASKIADPQLEERVGRLRYTLQRHRTEMGRVEGKVEDARRGAAGEAGLAGKDQELNERAATLRDTLPSVGSPSRAIDQVLDDVRELEDQVRRLRADEQIPPEIRRQREIELQERMELLMRQALERLGL